MVLAPVAAAVASVPAAAQLIGDRVTNDQRLCVYAGFDVAADGQSFPRTTLVPASQPCPAAAPFRDPNRPVPGNALLVREAVESGRRQCIYTQGGIEYSRTVSDAQRCAMTPDLLDRATAARDPGTLGR